MFAWMLQCFCPYKNGSLVNSFQRIREQTVKFFALEWKNVWMSQHAAPYNIPNLYLWCLQLSTIIIVSHRKLSLSFSENANDKRHNNDCVCDCRIIFKFSVCTSWILTAEMSHQHQLVGKLDYYSVICCNMDGGKSYKIFMEIIFTLSRFTLLYLSRICIYYKIYVRNT